MENDSGEIIAYIAQLVFWGWLVCVLGVCKRIRKIGEKRNNYKEPYIAVPGWMKKFFRLKQRRIPKWCYNMLIISFGYIPYFLLFVLLFCVFTDNSFFVFNIFVYGWCAIQFWVIIYSSRHMPSSKK